MRMPRDRVPWPPDGQGAPVMLDLNAYLGDLAPRERVYDVRLNRRLAMRVFPNGTRVWVYWRSPAKDTRGRTIGVFPQMSAEQALEDSNTVLEWSRFSNLPEADMPDDADFIQTGNFFQLKKREQRIREWIFRASAGAAVTLTAVLLLKWVLSPLFGHGPGNAVSRSPASVETAAKLAARDTAGSNSLPETATAPAETTTDEVERNARIRRATFASDVIEHEPVDSLGDKISSWPDKPRPVYLFTDLQNLAGQTVKHRWYWHNQLQTEVGFRVGSDWRWRVSSRRYIEPDQTGTWIVRVVTDGGDELASYSLRVEPAQNRQAAR